MKFHVEIHSWFIFMKKIVWNLHDSYVFHVFYCEKIEMTLLCTKRSENDACQGTMTKKQVTKRLFRASKPFFNWFCFPWVLKNSWERQHMACCDSKFSWQAWFQFQVLLMPASATKITLQFCSFCSAGRVLCILLETTAQNAIVLCFVIILEYWPE